MSSLQALCAFFALHAAISLPLGDATPASFATFGTGCPGSVGIPALDAAPGHLPWVGETFEIQFSNMPPNATNAAFGVLGLSKTEWGDAALPQDLSHAGIWNCTQYVSLDFVSLPLANMGGTATWVIEIPHDLSLIGLPFYVQGVAVDFGVNPGNAIVTNAGEGVIGGQGGGGGSNGGFFFWGNTRVDYQNTGGLTQGGSQQTPATTGDYEIVSFGASHYTPGVPGSRNEGRYFDEAGMVSQGFLAIRVLGNDDHKVELWARQNGGQNTIEIPARARVYNFLVLDGSDIQIDITPVDIADVRLRGQPYQVPISGGSGLKVLSYFSDDSVELTNVGNGTLVFQEWGFGDGDGFAVVLYEPDTAPPNTIAVLNSEPNGGFQYVGIMATFGRMQ